MWIQRYTALDGTGVAGPEGSPERQARAWICGVSLSGALTLDRCALPGSVIGLGKGVRMSATARARTVLRNGECAGSPVTDASVRALAEEITRRFGDRSAPPAAWVPARNRVLELLREIPEGGRR